MSRHAPSHGADSIESLQAAGIEVEREWLPVSDFCCDYCGTLRPIKCVTIGRSTSFLCDPCHRRQLARFAEGDR